MGISEATTIQTYVPQENKLVPRYYNPYKVLHKIDSMDYKMELPSPSRIHPIFHVSCLNKVIGDKLPIQTILLDLDEEGKVILEPKKFTKTRTKKLRNWANNNNNIKQCVKKNNYNI